MRKIGLYYFTNDLRFTHNELLALACDQVDELIGVVIPIQISPFVQHHSGEDQIGEQRLLFWQQSIEDLAKRFEVQNQSLFRMHSSEADDLIQLIETCQVSNIYCNQHPGSDESELIREVQESLPNTKVISTNNSTLLDKADLPFDLNKLPKSFTRFRKLIEADSALLNITEHSPAPLLPRISNALENTINSNPNISAVKISETNQASYPSSQSGAPIFEGGENAGIAHISDYFRHSYASHYKQTRNALDGMSHSTKFSPWLALGCLSPKTIVSTLRQYEDQYGSNESTYWIQFELLWREYFYWRARVTGSAVFTNPQDTHGLSTEAKVTFNRWKVGNTNYPIVDACMRELNATGYMSNRGRQLAASCLIYELGCDWRWGAAYFETQLVDYDVASNWGNWSYIAGMNGQQTRHFDLEKQTQMYDPQHKFIQRWSTTNELHQIAK
ncbi:DASH family cryptochrome [Vibrio sp. D420a]|uniref:DASH family cryptochrome n=1 Tax=Vibrio sp. D420a TaxID=2836895 RepID=UPI0025567FF8|nr:DASH family cryptochrome [Vibrio sp. D420a]MDK9763886.1 DASH family cryptochrome [Vibrio sp. D420a]